MSIKIDIDDLPGSVTKFTMRELAHCFLKINRNNQVLSIRIKESHLPTDCSRILTWNFWSAYGSVAGVSDMKRSVVRMILYSRTRKGSKLGESARESAQKIKNISLINRAEDDLTRLRAELENCESAADGDEEGDEEGATAIRSQIEIKRKLIATLSGEEEIKTSGSYVDPEQVGAIGRRVFDILKKGDPSGNAQILKSEFECIVTGVEPGRKDQHRFQEGGRTRVYKSDGAWRNRGKSGSGGRSKSGSKPKNQRPSGKPSGKFSNHNDRSMKPSKPGSYVPPHQRNGGKKFTEEEKSSTGGYVPPHMREDAKQFKEAQKDEAPPSDKYVPPSRRKTGRRYHENEQDDNYISLDNIAPESGLAFDAGSVFDFPELGNLCKKSPQPKPNKDAQETKKVVKIDTSNAFSRLADLEWGAEHDETSSDSDSVPEPQKPKSAWGGVSFAEIVKRAPAEKLDPDSDSDDEDGDWDNDWTVNSSGKKGVVSARLVDRNDRAKMKVLSTPKIKQLSRPQPIQNQNWDDDEWDDWGEGNAWGSVSTGTTLAGTTSRTPGLAPGPTLQQRAVGGYDRFFDGGEFDAYDEYDDYGEEY
jgi:hypothetical protein